MHTILDWREPREDVRKGRVKDKELAADLAAVVAGTATEECSAPVRFFSWHLPNSRAQDAVGNGPLDPTEEDETVDILRRRLFEEVDVAKARVIVDEYANPWDRDGGQICPDAASPKVRERVCVMKVGAL